MDVGAYPPDNGRNFDEYAVVSEMVRDRTSISMNHIQESLANANVKRATALHV